MIQSSSKLEPEVERRLIETEIRQLGQQLRENPNGQGSENLRIRKNSLEMRMKEIHEGVEVVRVENRIHRFQTAVKRRRLGDRNLREAVESLVPETPQKIESLIRQNRGLKES